MAAFWSATVSSYVASARQAAASAWVFWPTMMIGRSTNWMKVCAIQATSAKMLALISQPGKVCAKARNRDRTWAVTRTQAG